MIVLVCCGVVVCFDRICLFWSVVVLLCVVIEYDCFGVLWCCCVL